MEIAMNVKRWLGSVALVPAVGFASVQYDQARVVSVQPVIETVSYTAPRQVCQEQSIPYTQPGPATATPTVVGAVLGGALGNALGHDTQNEKVGAVVGAVLGGAVGYDWSRRRAAIAGTSPVYYRTQQLCSVVQDVREEEHIAGYDVTYTYLGQTYMTRMGYDPGRTVRVRVQVDPVH
jgi:uncharacterized protein YcfJ